MVIRSKLMKPEQKLELDLSGPEGNAYVLLGYAGRWGRQLGWSPEKIKTVQDMMKGGDYEVLVQVFDNFFGDYVTIWR